MNVFRRKLNKKGFTLTELIIVVAILGILAALASPLLIDYIDKAREEADNANATILENVIMRQIANEELAKSDLGTPATVIEAIENEVEPIPEPREGYAFVVDPDTGRVDVVLIASVGSLTVIAQNDPD